MLEEELESPDFKVFTDRVEVLHVEKAELHRQMIQAQIDFEERLHGVSIDN